MQEDGLQDYVRKKLQHSLFKYVWGLLLRDGYIDDVMYGASDRDWLVAKAREILDTRAAVKEPMEAPKDGPTPGHERAWALSQLVAYHAGTDPDVVAFRTKHLADGLVKWADLEKWIKARAELDGERTPDLTITLPVGTTVDRCPNGVLRIDPPLTEIQGQCRYTARTLAYALPGDEDVRHLGVTAGGVLDRLGNLADSLADSFGWQPAQAAVFVLTGITPFIVTVRTIVSPFKVRNWFDVGWACRIELDIDPAARPQEVLDAFESVRSEHRPAPRRALSVKHLRLAAFTGAEHVDKPWAERYRLWNERFPEWAFPAQSNFRRDAALAQRRVLYPGVTPTSWRAAETARTTRQSTPQGDQPTVQQPQERT